MNDNAPHNWRRTAMAVAVLGVASGGAAFAQFQYGPVVKLEPIYGGPCEDCNLSGRLLTEVSLSEGGFARAKFAGAVMDHVIGEGLVFEQADFTEAILDHANFVRADFGVSNLTRARLIGADFSGADLSRVVGLTQDQLSEACGDRDTRLPRGLVIPMCDREYSGVP